MPGLSITICNRNLPEYKGRKATIPEYSLMDYISTILEKQGCSVIRVVENKMELNPEGVLLIFGNANWYPTVCRMLMKIPAHKRPLTVIWHTEPLPLPKKAQLPRHYPNLREIGKILLCDARATDIYTNYFRLRSLIKNGIPDILLVSTQSRCEFLFENGISSHWIPLGYFPSMGKDMNLFRDIDILFLGALDVSRRKRLIRQLRERDVNLATLGDWFDEACWGENRTQIINRSKIFLNIHRVYGDLAGYRMILGMANKSLILSEPIYNPAPFIPGKHYISATIEEMPDVIDYYLNHEQERERIANEGHAFLMNELQLEHSIFHILKLIMEYHR
ncbi:MAG: glycosyltransferase family 1 protein [Planctomycetes bacterium]|nr:glycosyltransferase family 1 protein [Planctomycetota bacterium]MBM4064404.1 glycosyltransferase family 1 protein [Planctomycetota bacterium]